MPRKDTRWEYQPNGQMTPWSYAARRRALMQRICPTKRCWHCGKLAPSWQSLEFDHLDHGKAYEANKVGRDTRIRMYEREVEAGLPLVGSCAPCNKSGGGSKRYRWQDRRKRRDRGDGYSRRAFEAAQEEHYRRQAEVDAAAENVQAFATMRGQKPAVGEQMT